MNTLVRSVVLSLAGFGCVSGMAPAAEQPCFWLALEPPAGSARPGAPERVLAAMAAPGESSIIERLLHAAVTIADAGVPAELTVTRWPSEPSGLDAQWALSIRVQADEQQAWSAAAKAWKQAVPPAGPPRGWSVHEGVLRIAGGADAQARCEQDAAPRPAELKAHQEARGQGPLKTDGTEPFACWIDLNALRRQASDALALGPESRLLDQFGISNARAIGVWAHTSQAAGGAPSLLTLDLTWSARSTPPGTVRKSTLGESAWPPSLRAPATQPRWLFVLRADAGSNIAARGWGGWLRAAGAIALASRPGLHTGDEPSAAQQAWYMARSDQLRALTSRLDRWLVVFPAGGDGWLSASAPLRESASDQSSQVGAAIEAITQGLGGVSKTPGPPVHWSWPTLGLGLDLLADPRLGATVRLSSEHR